MCLPSGCESCTGSPALLSVRQPSRYPLWWQLLTSCGKIDLGVSQTGVEDGRVTEGVLFRGTHSSALEAVNKCKSWRQRGNKGEGNREDKDYALSPRPRKGGSSVSPLGPQFQNWLLQEILLVCWGLYWCHTLPPLPSNE